MVSRAELIADSALRLLGERGARALTHRAVDQDLALPLGSVSNLYRTRTALLLAANERLAGMDLAEMTAISDAIEGTVATPQIAAAGLAAVITHWTSGSRVLSLARLELYLEAQRDPDVAAGLAESRKAFEQLASTTLPTAGCQRPELHARPTVALIDGLVFNQLLHPVTRLTPQHLEDTLVRWFEAC